MAITTGAPKVRVHWSSGNMQVTDATGNVIATFDGANRKLSIPSGSTLENAGTLAFTGTQAFDDIEGNDSSLGITGLAVTAGTGGAVAIVGGATTTSGIGGAVSLTGGAGVATDAGGAASVRGGVGGTGATGNGGAASIVGGAAVSTNGSGGAVAATGGVATGTGTGGPVTITAGASAGAGGTGGSVNLASGAPAGGTDGGVNVQTVTTGKLGFFGVTAVVRQSAYTQTYSTADKTHANPTQQTVTAVANVTGATENYAFQDSSATVTQAEYRVFAKTCYLLFGQILADIADVKQLANAIIDDGQVYGLFQ